MTIHEKIDRIAELCKEWEHLKKEVSEVQNRCQHRWSKPFYDPEMQNVPDGGYYNEHRNDSSHVVHAWRKKTIDRWRKTCTECGLEVFTKQFKASKIGPGVIPDFGD